MRGWGSRRSSGHSPERLSSRPPRPKNMGHPAHNMNCEATIARVAAIADSRYSPPNRYNREPRRFAPDQRWWCHCFLESFTCHESQDRSAATAVGSASISRMMRADRPRGMHKVQQIGRLAMKVNVWSWTCVLAVTALFCSAVQADVYTDLGAIHNTGLAPT